MKFRVLLLACCMVFVPAAALFSHHLPPAVRAVPQRLFAPLAARVQPDPPSAPEAPEVTAAAGIAPPSVAGPAAGGVGAADLEALGAVAIECRPLPGGAGQIASCRMPVDDRGQLQRVFQARGVDADAAIRALATEVSAWRQRSAARPAVSRPW